VPKIGKSARTRATILNAALDFIWSHPFRDMTVNSLMASTGLSRSAFYQYCKDLHDLMESLLDMLIPDFDAYPVAEALNRLDVLTLLDAFGQRPRRKPEPVYEALERIWISTLYGSKRLGKGASDLVRT
jgi:AcrR family transcriptional regulator